MSKEFCDKEEHHSKYLAYRYTTKECVHDENIGNHIIPCPRLGAHSTLVCTICWKPVKIVNGVYWFVEKPKKEEA